MYYEILGENNKETIVLISGLHTQKLRWGLPFFENLIHSGLRILRSDYCEGGKGTWKRTQEKSPTINFLAVFLQDTTAENLPHTLWNKVADLHLVVSEHGFKKAHVMHRSIRSVISQLLTFRYPSLVKTLTLRMSKSQYPGLPKTDPNLVGLLMRIPKTYLDGKDASVGGKIGFEQRLSYTKAKIDLQEQRKFIIEQINRNGGQIEPFRQTIALASYVYNKPILSAIQTPNLDTYDTEVPLFYPKTAKELADTLPDSRLIMLQDIGHCISDMIFNTISEDIKRFIGDDM